MKKLCTFVFALLLTNVVMGAEALKAKVTWVSDGDSFIVEKEDGSTARVRCACIDAPENDQPYGDTAKKAAIKMLKDKEILVQVVKVDKYGRIVGRIAVKQDDGKYLDYEYYMLENGHVWQFSKAYPDEKAKAIETEARKKKLGLWGTKNPVEPWEWRWRGMGQGKWHERD